MKIHVSDPCDRPSSVNSPTFRYSGSEGRARSRLTEGEVQAALALAKVRLAKFFDIRSFVEN